MNIVMICYHLTMANLLQQKALRGVVQKCSKDYGLPEHKAFLFFVIENYLAKLELNEIEIEDAIIDGSNDGGIDAIYIDEETEDFPTVYFFQSKYYLTENAYERNFEATALEKIKGAIDDFILKGKISSSYQNERLIDKLQSIRNLASNAPRYIVVFCSNSLEPSPSAKGRFEDFVKEVNDGTGGEYLRAEYIHLDYIVREFLASKQKKRIDIDLQTSGEYLRQDTGNVRLFVGSVKADVLVSVAENHGDNLFERNVRGYLRKSNPINKDIILTSSGDFSPYFIYMNNGITITCEKFEFSPTDSSPILKIHNAQIVNGQQTTRSLLQAKNSGLLKPDVKVLVRIVETTDSNLLSEIIEATNSQTKVTSRDLHSNDEHQKLIEQDLLSKGYFYEARKDKYRGKETKKRIDAEVAAQAYYACKFCQPALAKDKKRWLFGDKYEEIFTDKLKPEDLLLSFLLLSVVRDLNEEKKYSDKYSFLRDATLHTVALIYQNFGENSSFSLISSKYVEPHYKEAIKALDKLVKERSKEEGNKYEHRRTFKDPNTFGRAVEILKESKRS